MSESKLKLKVPDLAYWQENISCQYACPVRTDSRGYVRAIADGDFEKAYLIARGPNPLASICGRVCAAPCEMACRRGTIDDPISIRVLKRFVTSEYGPEANPTEGFFKYLRDHLKKRQCEGVEELRNLMGEKSPLKEKDRKVAIVGSGPAGLACAHDLALMGFEPTIYEMERVAAGMLYVGVPEYRLPRDLIHAEVEVIKSLGVEIKCDTCVGKDVTMEQLTEQHSAVVLAVGAKKSRALPIPGVEGPGVLPGIDFLRDVALGESVTLGKEIIVIGGGSVSYDVARSAWRNAGEAVIPDPASGEQSAAHYAYEDVTTMAARQSNGRVHLCCLESREQMLADPADIREGEEEGIVRHNGIGPQEILRDSDGKVTGIRFAKVKSLFDAEGRFSPVFEEDGGEIIECDTVLIAVGQVCDLEFLSDGKGEDVKLNGRGYPDHDQESLMTSANGVFVAGDLQTGPRLIIDAVASGKKAARGVYEFVAGRKFKAEQFESHFEIDDYTREEGYEVVPRTAAPTIHPDKRRTHSEVVEEGFAKSDALREASRCLDCGVNTIFNGERCILCGGCADACPELCLKLVSADKLDPNDETLAKVLAGCAEGKDLSECSVIVKDEDRCIRCGLCAERCPVDAITMERFCFEEKLESVSSKT